MANDKLKVNSIKTKPTVTIYSRDYDNEKSKLYAPQPYDSYHELTRSEPSHIRLNQHPLSVCVL